MCACAFEPGSTYSTPPHSQLRRRRRQLRHHHGDSFLCARVVSLFLWLEEEWVGGWVGGWGCVQGPDTSVYVPTATPPRRPPAVVYNGGHDDSYKGFAITSDVGSAAAMIAGSAAVTAAIPAAIPAATAPSSCVSKPERSKTKHASGGTD